MQFRRKLLHRPFDLRRQLRRFTVILSHGLHGIVKYPSDAFFRISLLLGRHLGSFRNTMNSDILLSSHTVFLPTIKYGSEHIRMHIFLSGIRKGERILMAYSSNWDHLNQT